MGKADPNLQLTLIKKYFDLLLQSENLPTAACHDSRYDQQGVRQKGPAKLNLKKLRLEQTEDGNLHIFTT